MPRGRQPRVPSPDGTFTVQLRLALEHFTEPEWLGMHSSLAQPYVLGQRLLRYQDANTSRRRGQVLQLLLLEACAAMGENDQQKQLGMREDLKRRVETGRSQDHDLYIQHLKAYLEAAGKVFTGGMGHSC